MAYLSRLISFVFFFSFALIVRANSIYEGSIKLEFPDDSQVFFLPVPQKTFSTNNVFTLKYNNELIDANFSYALLWPNLESNFPNIRVLSIQLAEPIDNKNLLTLEWKVSAIKLQQSSRDIQSNARLVYPSLNWLRKVMLVTDNSGVDETWYRHNQELSAIYLADEKQLKENGYPKTVASQWLYDRAQAFYQLYLSINKPIVKRQADEFVRFYKSQINENGYFKLSKPRDIKYLMGRSLVYDYLLNNSASSKVVLTRMFDASLSWRNNYDGTGFWTERHHAAALNVAISYWEVSGDKKAKERIEELIAVLTKLTFQPEGKWALRNCPQHTFKSHEGWGDNTPACSPWMMALLADNLWRYYLLTEDINSANLLSSFSTFVLNDGIYFGKKRLKGRVIPKYIASLDNSKQEELEQYSDLQHTCDVAAMVGKGVFIKKKQKKEHFLEYALFEALSGKCKDDNLAIIEKYKYVSKKSLKSRPPRKFSWNYSSTDDLPWLMSILSTPKLSD